MPELHDESLKLYVEKTDREGVADESDGQKKGILPAQHFLAENCFLSLKEVADKNSRPISLCILRLWFLLSVTGNVYAVIIYSYLLCRICCFTEDNRKPPECTGDKNINALIYWFV